MGAEDNIEQLWQQVERSFSCYQQAHQDFFHSLELWLWCMPLLQEEDNQQQMVEQIIAKVKAIVEEDKDLDILQVVRQVTKQMVAKMRSRAKPVYDPQLIDKLAVQSPQGAGSEQEISPSMKKLPPMYRLLLSLYQRGVPKKEIAAMLFVSPAQVTNYFHKLEREMHKICGGKE